MNQKQTLANRLLTFLVGKPKPKSKPKYEYVQIGTHLTLRNSRRNVSPEHQSVPIFRRVAVVD